MKRRGFLLLWMSLLALPMSINAIIPREASGAGNWKSTGPTAMSVGRLVIDPSNTSTIYAAVSTGTNTLIAKSTNGGITWSATNGIPANTGLSCLAIDPSNTSIIYAGIGYGGVFKSINGGANWSAASTGIPTSDWVYALAIDPSNTSVIYAGTESGVYKTINGGANWSAASTGIPSGNNAETSIAIDPSNTSIVYAVTYGYVVKSINGGNSWNAIYTGNWGGRLVIDPLNTNIIYLGCDRGMLKSTDGGATWSTLNLFISMPPNDYGYNPYIYALAIDPLNTNTIYAVSDTCLDDVCFEVFFSISKSTDGGATWSTTRSPANTYIYDLAIDPSRYKCHLHRYQSGYI